jgi:putative aldouronate transport system substrate-binding protein
MLKLKRFLCALLAACMVVGIFASCGTTETAETQESSAEERVSVSETAEVSAPDASTDDESPAEVADEPDSSAETVAVPSVTLPLDDRITVSYWYILAVSEYMPEELQLFQELTNRSNVEFEYRTVASTAASDQFQLMSATGDLCDILTMAMTYYSGSIDSAVSEEILYDYSDKLDEMPNYSAILDEYSSDIPAITGSNGEMVEFPTFFLESGLDASGYLINKDWLDALNMDVPTTYDELYEVMTAFHNNYGASMELFASGGDLLGLGFGVNTVMGTNSVDGWYVEDGTVKLGMLEDGFADYISLAAQWYQEGLIDENFMNSDRSDLSPCIAGTFGVKVMAPEIIGVMQNINGSNWVAMDLPKQQADDQIQICGSPTTCFKDATAWSLSYNTEYADELLQLIDYIYSDEGTLLMNWGIEDETFTYDADGNPQYTELITANETYDFDFAITGYVLATSNRSNVPYVTDYRRYFFDYTDAENEAVDIYMNQCDHSMDYPASAAMNGEETEQFNSVAGDIATYISENILKFITGQTSMDQWSSFVDTLYTMGIENCVEAKQAAYDDYLAMLR